MHKRLWKWSPFNERKTEGKEAAEKEGKRNESSGAHLRVHPVVPAVYDGPQETTGFSDLHCK